MILLTSCVNCRQMIRFQWSSVSLLIWIDDEGSTHCRGQNGLQDHVVPADILVLQMALVEMRKVDDELSHPTSIDYADAIGREFSRQTHDREQPPNGRHHHPAEINIDMDSIRDALTDEDFPDK